MSAVLLAWLDGLTAGAYLCMGAMVLVGAVMQGMGGVGYAMFCAPLGMLFFPELVPGPLLAVGVPLAWMAYRRERHALQIRAAIAALAGRIAGTLVAAVLLSVFSAHALAVLFAVLILLAVGLSMSGWRLEPTPATLSIAGVASGIMGTITSTGGPPFAVAMQNMPPAAMRATLGMVFLVGAMVSVAALAWIGKMGAAQWLYSLALAPWMLAGFHLSNHLTERVSKAQVRTWLLGTALVSSLVILGRTLLV